MDCCVGKTNVSFGQWYCPIGKESSQFTYCEYCYENGCVDKSAVYEVKSTESNKYILFNCDCPNQSHHETIVPLKCPSCNLEKSECFICACGTCATCGIQISLSAFKLCDGCSYRYNACHKCGNKIIDGNSYIKNIENYIKDRLDEFDAYSKIISDRQKENGFIDEIDGPQIKFNESHKKDYQESLECIKKMYANKNADDMIQILIDERRSHSAKRTENTQPQNN
jgi:hypothetical protein